MQYIPKNLRPFIGAKKFDESRKFYRELGFSESIISPDMSLFKVDEHMAFYLQDYYVKDWINNSMIFLEVENVDECWKELYNLGLVDKYKYVRLSEIKVFDWGRECFLHDPSGILWHFGEFK